MEFVDGTTLADLLRERGPLDLSRAGEIAAQLLAGLEAIHAVSERRLGGRHPGRRARRHAGVPGAQTRAGVVTIGRLTVG
jgi:hypothetical protein